MEEETLLGGGGGSHVSPRVLAGPPVEIVLRSTYTAVLVWRS